MSQHSLGDSTRAAAAFWQGRRRKMPKSLRKLLRKQQLLGHPGFHFQQDPSGDHKFSPLYQTARFTILPDHLSDAVKRTRKVMCQIEARYFQNNLAALFKAMLFYRSYYNTPGFFRVVSSDTLSCDPGIINDIQMAFVAARETFLQSSSATPTVVARLVDEWISFKQLAKRDPDFRQLASSEKSTWLSLQAEWGAMLQRGLLLNLGGVSGSTKMQRPLRPEKCTAETPETEYLPSSQSGRGSSEVSVREEDLGESSDAAVRPASPRARHLTSHKRKAVDEREEPFKRRKDSPTTTVAGYETSTPTISEAASPNSGAEAEAISQALERLYNKLDALEKQQKHAHRKAKRRHSGYIEQFEELGNAQATTRVAFEEQAASLTTYQRQVVDDHAQRHTSPNKQIEELRTTIINHDLRISTQDSKIATNALQVEGLSTRVDLMGSASQVRTSPPLEARVDDERLREVQESVKSLELRTGIFDHAETLREVQESIKTLERRIGVSDYAETLRTVQESIRALEGRADHVDHEMKEEYTERRMNDDVLLEAMQRETQTLTRRADNYDTLGDRHETTLLEHEKAHTSLCRRTFDIERNVLPDLIGHGPRIEKLERAAAATDEPQPPPRRDHELDIQKVVDHGDRIEKLELGTQRLAEHGDRIEKLEQANCSYRIEKLEEADYGHRIEKLEQANCIHQIEKLEEADYGRRIGELEQIATKAQSSMSADGDVGNETQAGAKLDVSHELGTLRELIKSQNEVICDLRGMLEDHRRVLEESRREMGKMKADIFGYPYQPT